MSQVFSISPAQPMVSGPHLRELISAPERALARPARKVVSSVPASEVVSVDTAFSNVGADDTMFLFPSFGHLTDDKQAWNVTIRGAVFEPGQLNMRKRIMLRVLQRIMKAESEALQSDLFHQRIKGFIAGSGRRRQISVRIGSRIHELENKSERGGHFCSTVRLDFDELRQLEEAGHIAGGWLNFDVLTPHPSHANVQGSVQLLGDAGLSIVSDIDDTIKHTGVGCRRSLLQNTFLREFQSIGGMARVYQSWAQQGAAFHYVSSSPWQLFDPLAKFCERDGFPTGSFHLRLFRLGEQMLRRILLMRRPGKAAVIASIIRTFPKRRFVLVGDSGEHDPELYGDIARRFPQQVASIFIRDLPTRQVDFGRHERAFRGLPAGKCKLFRDAEELHDLFPAAERAAMCWRGVKVPLAC